ncbi:MULTISPECIES: hypothetical protein [unclassified Pseudonocardia]|uniref:hypothetical protein n=1 Tax=unclassified Pseudonocardia TaxID=2619320 RepID=UPI00094B119F|nr:hypothetical protein [Pseudonocardia sp. Ae707_Ps1]OLM09171.1 hypothetical protein Ae707Ps1_6118 [Pseudonocardia sp. Ae707_Ps1]
MLDPESAASAQASPPGPVTTTTAMTRLGCNRDQVVRLVATGLLPELGRRGRTRLLDPAALAALARRPVLPDAADQPAAATYALALHLGPRTAEERPDLYYRDTHGYYADQNTPDNAWTGWWNTGEQLARACVARTLPLLPAVSGVVVDVRVIIGFDVHPLYPGLIRFDLAAASESVRARFTGTRFRPGAGTPWQRLRQPVAGRELGAGDTPAGATAPVPATGDRWSW